MALSIADTVYRHLYEDIRNGDAAPGTVLREDVVARAHAVSRTPVREALQRLLHEGLLERASQGFLVRRLAPDQVREIYPIIAVLEGLGARLAADRATDEQLADIEVAQQSFVDASQAGDADEARRWNLRFHGIVLEAAGSATLSQEIDRFRAITERFRSVVLGIAWRREQSIAEHADLIDALRRRDGDQAELVMRNHVATAQEILLALIGANQYLEQPRTGLTQEQATD